MRRGIGTRSQMDSECGGHVDFVGGVQRTATQYDKLRNAATRNRRVAGRRTMALK